MELANEAARMFGAGLYDIESRDEHTPPHRLALRTTALGFASGIVKCSARDLVKLLGRHWANLAKFALQSG